MYGIGHWCPRVAAYSDQNGWASGASGIAEASHAEYGSFDYSITVPASFIVAGSGTLMNPSKVLTSDQRRRLLQAQSGDQKVAIITPNEAGTPNTRPQQSGTLTWRFQMNGVRDVAWAASPEFIWSGAGFSRPGKQNALAMSYYPPSTMGGAGWNRATYHAQKSAALYSERVAPFPWNNTTIVTGPDSEAFPGLSICPPSATGKALFSCTVRNQSASWFPGIVASDPDRNPWLSAGLRTYLSTEAHRLLYDGAFYSRQYTGGTETQTTARAVARRLKNGDSRSILAAPSPSTSATAFVRSVKPAFGPKHGARAQLSLQKKMPMPVRARVVEVDGDTLNLHLPVEIWREGSPCTVSLDTDSPIKTFTIDPNRVLPDANYANNTWTSPNP